MRGAATLYRIHDVGYGIALERVTALLAERMPARARPERREGQAIHIPNPPITVPLATERLVLDDREHVAELSARLFDFGVVSLRMRVNTPGELAWPEFVAFGTRMDTRAETTRLFDAALERLLAQIAPAVDRLRVADVTEDYTVYRVSSLRDANDRALAPGTLDDADVVPLLLKERRTLSADARRELLPHRFSYYADDLAILTWDNALVVDPAPDEETDVDYILEFANAQLLELRFYDALLDAELPRMYDRVEAARRGFRAQLSRRMRNVLGRLQQTVADSTEIVERVENSLKVTDDVYLARIYVAALELFRGQTWRRGIERKLAIFRETYAMLNAESQASRAEVMEAAIVLLIVAELLIALLRA